jgi:hypothetical protein
MTQYTKSDGTTASEMMWDAGMGGAGPYVYCSCGKDHSLDVPDDEPDSYYNDQEMFEYIEIDGQLFVYDCDGCKTKLLKYEKFIWNNRDTIRRYLKTRIDQEKSWAEQEHMLNTLAGI